jgi:hypothetical protein
MFCALLTNPLDATQHSRINPPVGNAVAALRKPHLSQCGKAVIVSAMAEDGKKTGPDTSVEDLAKRLMDLWQEQMAAIAADPDLMRQMAQMMAASPFPAMMQGIMQGILAANAKPASGVGYNPYEWWKSDNGPGAKPSAAAGTPAAAAASQPGGGDLAELRRNLAGLEARLAELGGQGTGEPAARPGKPKRTARKPAKPVAGPAGGGGESGTGGAGGGAAG